MGGASRNEKKRKQEAVLGRAASTAGSRQEPQLSTLQQDQDPRRKVFVGLAVLAVLALVVGAVFLLTRPSGDPTAAAPVAPAYTATADGGVVTAGTGPVAIDVYTDYLCPFCGEFEQDHGNELTAALNDGRATVRFHQIAILDSRSDPEGYSTRAAAAALCAVDAGVYPTYAQQLWAQQPAEGSAGLSDDELTAIGTGLGADLAPCISAGTHTADVASATQAALADPVAAPDGRFGTPTVVIDGAIVDTSDSAWLTDALS